MNTTLRVERRLACVACVALACLFTNHVRGAGAEAASPAAGTNAVSSPAAGTNAPSAQAATEKEDEKSADTESQEFRNWVTLGFGGTWREGDKGAFSQRLGLPSGAFGGIDSLHYERDVGKKGIFSLDGRGIFDNDDYAVRLQLADPDKGFIRAGYREFRRWYDGSGGFSPSNRVWLNLYDDEFYLNRGDAFVELGLTLPEVPQVTVRYDHQFREGQKDSTHWGDYNVNFNTAIAGTALRGIAPTFSDIDEKRDIVRGDVRHTLGKTGFGAGIVYEHAEINNSLNIHRRPGEPASRYVSQENEQTTDLFNVHAFTETRFSEKVLFTLGYSWTTMDTDLGGSRIYGDRYNADFDPMFAGRQAGDRGYYGLGGGSQYEQNVGSVNLMWTPIESLAIVPSVRIEQEGLSGKSAFTQWDVASATAAATTQDIAARNDRDLIDVTESLELRYSGLTNWTFYTKGQWLEGQGDVQEADTQAAPLQRDTDMDRFFQKYAAGVNWYPLRILNFGAQYYFRSQDYDYTHIVDSTPNAPPSGNRYPAIIANQVFDTHDANIRATWRALRNLTLTARYDFQYTTIDTQLDQLPDSQQAETTSHIVSANVSWIPCPRVYVQLNGSYSFDHTDTGADNATGAAANLVPNFSNDYWMAGATVGYALSDKTDLQAGYFYYLADNYVPYIVTQPYGSGLEEQGATAGISHRFTARLRGSLKYSFLTSNDRTSGGFNDFTAHVIYSTLQIMF